MHRLLARRVPLGVPSTLVRTLATKGSVVPVAPPKKDLSLSALLSNEIRFEQEDTSAFDKVEEFKASLAAKWTITDEAGTSRLRLVSVDGRVTIDLDVTPIPDPGFDEDEEDGEEEQGEEEEEEEDEEEPDSYRLLVTIKGKEKTMRVGCMTRDFLKIHRVSTHDNDAVPSANAAFAGEEDGSYAPSFDELDQKLQNGFYEHLAKCVRGSGAPPPPSPLFASA